MKTGEITVLSASMFQSGSDYFWVGDLEHLLEKYPVLEFPNKRRFYVFLIIERAQGGVVVDGNALRLDHPKIICVKPDSIFSLEINRTAKGTILCFTEEFFSIRYNNNALSNFTFLEREYGCYVRLAEEKAKEWEQLSVFMKQEYAGQQKGADSVLRSFLNIMLCKLDREFSHVIPLMKKNTYEEKIKQFRSLLDEHFITHKTPAFYASRLNITTNYLNKLCGKYYGVSTGELIRRRITIEAQRLLHYTVLPIADIARQLEFESVSYFITFFKRDVGTTPENFRKNH
ncbi:MAG: helix-turn-helix domain-containing protein [Chitinophaga sp.]|uniref:helix-turn-helix domain-containing protein n=1 Tax=Chitinophaga sp. TaxID=1869181 RepID=UPI001B10DD10|nr:AraC family transcriptional regulator [Chitinophaga sp.]MBO9732096.1 helix-turn-helix domain-containing protein [Chitinophaga sp.]